MSEDTKKMNLEILVQTKDLVHALSFANSIVEKRNVLQELNNIKLVAKSGILEIGATDMDLYLNQEIGAEVLCMGETTVSTQILSDIVRKIPDAKIKIRQVSDSNKIEITGANIENIMDITYQRELMKEWIKREGKIVDFDRIVSLDNKVNGELNLEDNSSRHTTWSIKWLMIDNFLSFGAQNYLPFNKLKGLTVVNSQPANQGGKCVRADTKVNIQFDKEEIIKKLGFLPDELK